MREDIRQVLAVGETVAVEFKRCGNGIPSDAYESICAFLNRFGGDIYFGVLDDGTVEGVPPDAAPGWICNLVNTLGNPNLFVPAVHLEPELLDIHGKTVIRLHVPQTPDIYRFKGTIFDRLGDSDVKVVASSEIAAMGIRKQQIYTERKIFPHVKPSDLRLDLLPRIRIRAANFSGGRHPWTDMSDDELFQSARLVGEDKVTGEKGFNLAAVMLLGKDDLILDLCPAYMTDAIFRRVQADRYDDRDIVQTNLVESVDRLMAFAVKHLPDPFFLDEQARRISVRDIVVREMLVNMLIHREFTSSRRSRFVIEAGRMFTENPCRAVREGFITPDNLEPDPKNPIVAAFFRTIGFADELGSGVRKMFKYSRPFAGADPSLQEGDVFRTSVTLAADWFVDGVPINEGETINVPINVPINEGETINVPINVPINEGETVKVPINRRVMELVGSRPGLNRKQLAQLLEVDVKTIGRALAELSQQVEHRGSKKTGGYYLISNAVQTNSTEAPIP